MDKVDKVYEYDMVVNLASKIIDFIFDVDKALKDGWQCQGGVAVNLDKNNVEWLYQAMIREVNED